MPTISLTSFVDFVSAAGPSKLTVVRRTKKQMEDSYGPEKDFYKRIREAIIEMHRTGDTLARVTGILPSLTDKKKIDNYPQLIEGYKKWRGRKGAEWFEPTHAQWHGGGLAVRVNPELGLTIDGTPHLVKLYFKADKLAKRRIDLITHLMAVACTDPAPGGCIMGVLDVRRSKLITPTVPINRLDTMLRAEAAYWVSAWSDLS